MSKDKRGKRQRPVIVVHAITGAVLADSYFVPPEAVWDPTPSMTHPIPVREFLRLAMHPDDLRYEAIEPARIQPAHQLSMVYGELVTALRYDLSPRQDEPTPVFPFAYDWRQDNAFTIRHLADFIREVVDRTRLVKHYAEGWDGAVDLVGHSMGGLVIAGCLSRGLADEDGRSLVGKVVTLGTPFRGAVDAITKLATGESEIVGVARNQERESARLTPSVYQLLPSYPGAFVEVSGGAQEDLDIFNPRYWQQTVVASIAEFVRLYGGGGGDSKANRERKAAKVLKQLLGNALDFRKLTEDELEVGQALRDGKEGWLLIVGKDRSTRYQAQLKQPEKRFGFVAEKDYERGGGQQPSEQKARQNLGDDTVPLEGAIPRWADRQRVVCVTVDDVSAFEFRDRALLKVGGFHAALPAINLVQRWVISFFKGKRTGDLWGRALPSLGPGQVWTSPVPGASLKED